MTPRQAAYNYRRCKAARRKAGKRVLPDRPALAAVTTRPKPAKMCPLDDLPPYLQEARREYVEATKDLSKLKPLVLPKRRWT